MNDILFRGSKFRKMLAQYLLGGLLIIILIASVLLTKNYLFESQNSDISKFDYYLILAVFSFMFLGILIVLTRPLFRQVFGLDNSKRFTKSEDTLGSCESDLEFQQKSIAALLSISEAGGNFLPLDQVFHHALRVVQEVTGFNTVVIRLYDEKAQCLRLAAQQGMSPSMQRELAVVPIKDRFEGDALRSFWPIPIEDLAAEDASWVGASPSTSGFRSVVCVPLVSGEVPIGTMELGSKTPYKTKQDELRWFALVGRAIGAIVHQVRLTEHLRDFAALQERSRLAQELHDGLVQLIGSINLWSQEAQEAMAAEDYAATQEALSRIETFSSDAYASLREELLGLRDTFDAERNLPSVLREYLSRFKRHWGIETELIIDETQDLTISKIISPAAEIQMSRIVQEAMTNVRRHAHANKVVLSVFVDKKIIRVILQDDGQGFNPGEVTGNHLGLNIMRERATSVGGKIKIESKPGEGTTIKIEMPRQKTGVVNRRVR